MENSYGESVSERIQKAKELATQKHAHLFLYDAKKTPAIVHIAEVSDMVETHGGTDDMIAAAWLHDIVEDTDVTLPQIVETFGKNVADIVDGLTDPEDFANMDLSLRKKAQADRLKFKSRDIKIIKICDQTSNVRRVANNPPVDWDDAKKLEYVVGAKQVVDVCKGLHQNLDILFNDAFEKAYSIYKG